MMRAPARRAMIPHGVQRAAVLLVAFCIILFVFWYIRASTAWAVSAEISGGTLDGLLAGREAVRQMGYNLLKLAAGLQMRYDCKSGPNIATAFDSIARQRSHSYRIPHIVPAS